MHQLVDSGESPRRSRERGSMTLAIQPRRRMSQALVDLWGPVMPSVRPARGTPIGLAAEMKIGPVMPTGPVSGTRWPIDEVPASSGKVRSAPFVPHGSSDLTH
jgi:hypothetical protein